MANIIKSFIPWILFFILFGHSQGSIEIASIAALISHLVLNFQTIKKGFVFDIGGLLFFALYALNVFIIQYPIITNNGYLLSGLAIAIIAWVSLFIKKPFSLQYAQLNAPAEAKHSPLFLFVNYVITLIWAVLLTLMILPNIIEAFHPFNYFEDIDLGASIILIFVGVWLTNFLPEWLVNKGIDKKFNIQIKTLFNKYKKPRLDLTHFNADMVNEKADAEYDVIVIGAGPVGLSTALLLKQQGIKVLVVEKHPGISIHPKARAISCRSMELIRKLDIEKQVKKYNLAEHKSGFGWFYKLSEKFQGRIYPNDHYSEISPTKPSSAAQQFLEGEILKKYKELKGEILFNGQVTDIAQNDQTVQINVKDRKSNKSVCFHSKYLVAADGAYSSVRSQFKIPMIGPEEINVNASVYCEIDLNSLVKTENQCGIAYIVQKDGNPSPMIISIDGDKKWIFLFPSAGVNGQAYKKIFTQDYAKQKIYEIIGDSSLPIDIISLQVWSLGSQIATQFSGGRTFLAGDSIHRFSPTGGMGMNTGLQDADNLAWKLAYAVKNQAKVNILDTYEIERLPSILNNMDWSLKNLYRIVNIQRSFMKHVKSGESIQSIVQQQEAHLNKSGIDLGIIYHSDIVSTTQKPQPNIPSDHYFNVIYPGARLPHFEIIKENYYISTLDLISTQFIFLATHKAQNQIDKIDFETIPTDTIVLGDLRDSESLYKGEFRKSLGLNAHSALWVRPDGHIAWCGQLDNEQEILELEQLISRISTKP
jgi:putative polyketide hydroxylase